jgi:hypothetical protein
MNKTALLLLSVFCAGFVCFAQGPTIGNCPTFPADNIWNAPVDQLPVSPNSSTYVNTIGATKPVHPDFGTVYNGAPNGIPFITVPGSQTKYPVTFQYASESDPGPYAIPLTAPIEGGSQGTGDRHAIAIDTDNCILYELYAAYPQASSWQAGSGVIFSLKSDNLRTATWTSADAAGLPIFPGLVRYDEVQAGAIHHALRFTVPQTQKAYVWPARHYASSLTGTQYPPMGVRFRLKASFDISGFSAANQVILQALKKYGMMIADNGSAWYLSGAPDSRWSDDDLHNLSKLVGSDFEVVDVTPLMVNPNTAQAAQSNVTVSVTPATASVQVNATKQFTSTVTNASNPAVNWSVNGAIGGNSAVGLISLTGLYTAPAVVPSPATVTIEAASQSTPAAFATASLMITPAPAPPPPPPAVTVIISPTAVTIRTTHLKQFSASVHGSTNKSVIWKVNGITGGNGTVGTISSQGLYKAPSTVPSSPVVTVSAVAATDGKTSASAAVTISASAPIQHAGPR